MRPVDLAQRTGIDSSTWGRLLKNQVNFIQPTTEEAINQVFGLAPREFEAPGWMLAEERATYRYMDKFDSLGSFVKSLPPKKQDIFFALAEGLGWEPPEE